MKRILWIFSAAIVAIVSSCTKEDVEYMTAAEVLFEVSATDIYRDESVTFTDKSNPLTGTEIVEWAWNFGVDDDSISYEQNPTYTFGSIGSFTTTLTVTDSQGRSAIATQVITVNTPYEELAHALFSMNESVDIGDLVSFVDESIPSDGATIESWSWNFGYDSDAVSTEQNPTYTYAQSGYYNVTLSIVDSNGLSSSLTQEIHVVDPSEKVVVTWKSDLYSHINNSVSPAMSPDGTVAYMWTNGTYSDGSYQDDVVLKAYNVSTGALEWSFDVSGAYEELKTGSMVNQIYSSPSVGANGDIYLTGRDLRSDDTSQRNTYMIAVKADGSGVRWSYNFGCAANFNFITPVIDADGSVYISHLSVTPYQIVKLNPETGAVEQTVATTYGTRGGMALDRSGNIYTYTTGANGMYKYNVSSAAEAWSYNTSFSTTGGSIAIDSDGVVYAVAEGNSCGIVVALNPDGSQKWEFTTPGAIQYGGLVLGENNIAYFSGGQTSAITDSAGVYAVNQSTGELVWHYPTTESVNNCVPVVDNRGYVHFITDSATYYVIDDNGDLYGKASLGYQSYSSPVINDNGDVIIAVQDSDGVSSIYCLNTGAEGPANSAWPMKGQNMTRTHLQSAF